jgi:2-keto-3-deoxy-L-rhamnonate aldolase RhmA
MVRDAVYLPPRGKRRPGGMGNYWMRDVHYSNWRDEFEANFVVIPQIETRVGVQNVPAIAAHALTTAVGLGPYDLSADMGCCWEPDNAEHKRAIETIREASEAAGKPVWIGCDAHRLRAEGYSFLWIGSVSGLLLDGFAANVEALRKTRA